jgi:serine/threonine protein kinase
MLTGLPPFYCRDREKLFEKIRTGVLTYPRYLSTRAQGVLRGLLTRDPTKRLGSGPADAEDIKAHLFFSDINWEKLSKGQIPPPFVPIVKNSLDTSQFDNEFTSLPMFSPESYIVSRISPIR